MRYAIAKLGVQAELTTFKEGADLKYVGEQLLRHDISMEKFDWKTDKGIVAYLESCMEDLEYMEFQDTGVCADWVAEHIAHGKHHIVKLTEKAKTWESIDSDERDVIFDTVWTILNKAIENENAPL